MDPHFLVTREEFQDVQMDLKRIQTIQQHHGERLRMLEKRQADDAQLRSVWNSPFPSVLGGTPQHGPVHIPPANDDFDDLDEHSQNLLQSIHLDAVEDEPIRRGAASRANSVRFDESALQGSSWAHQGRHSGEFGPVRPSSGFGTQMERSLSHKSDGRHSSAGHSVHSVHSGISGRASSLGLDTNFVVGGHEDDSPLDIPEPPPGFFYAGSAPAIIRCWVTTNFASDTLLYAVVCTGSQKSTIEFSLLKELSLINSIHRDADGVPRITLPIFLAEARVTQPNSRSPSPAPQLPSMTSSFEVVGLDQPETPDMRKGLRIFIGSHTLRLHSADLLFSQNLMTLYGTERDKLSVPFVRPEDDSIFRHIATTNLAPERPRLNATAPEFISGDKSKSSGPDSTAESVASQSKLGENEMAPFSPTSQLSQAGKTATSATSAASESGAESERHPGDLGMPEPSPRDLHTAGETGRRESSAAIRTPWRQTAAANGAENGQRENASLSGYQPAGRPRGMKILKPSKSSSSSVRTGAAYEPAPPTRSSGEFRRKSGESLNSIAAGSTGSGGAPIRWGDPKRNASAVSLATDGKHASSSSTSETGKGSTGPRTTTNPLGNASAFAFLSGGKPKTPSAAAD
ncbi:hypothetical protein GQ53DRAFT_642534 [Thozetella sp. PMI_491]|nr:hypothetical protein GQ53DRAFT_642534 [Thozetella sp. PMI_491]